MKWNVKEVKSQIYWVEKTDTRFIYRHRFQEKFKALAIYLKVIPILRVLISTTPCGNTDLTTNGLVHLDFSFPEKR